MKMRKRFIISIPLFFYSQVLPQGIPPPGNPQQQNISASEKKISSLVRHVSSEMSNRGLNAMNIQSTGFSEDQSNFLFQVDGLARIRLTISYEGNMAPVADLIAQASGLIETYNEELKMIVAWVPYQNVNLVAAEPFIRNIKETERGHLRSGLVTSEGDSIHKTDLVRSYLGADGSGITVGVISDGCNSIADAQASGDLPLSINVINNLAGGDEGTAMMEIIHDLAPGASLAFSTGFLSQVGFVNSINDLVAAGCDVVVDDIGYFGEAWFEEGPIATAARNAIESGGIVYASAAGNSADMHYEGDFLSAGTQLGLNTVHDFSGSGDWTQQIRIGGQTTVYLFLQWSEPFGGATSEYNLYLADGVASQLLSVTRSRPDIDDPYLYIIYRNNRPIVQTYNVIIEKVSGSDRRVELAYNWAGSSSIAVDEYYDLPGSINGQPAVTEAIAAGAVRYESPDIIEYFSSLGPSRIYSYPGFTYEDRAKPDIVAVDGNIITGAGGFGQEYPVGSGDIRFFGTSAAAPHAAACAAVIWSAYPLLTHSQVRQRLLDSAVDLGAPGFDYTFGHGRIDAQQASDSPEFLVSGINGGSDDLLNAGIIPGDNMAELTGYTLTADQSPYLCYLDSMRFYLGGTVDAADFNNFFLYADLNSDHIITAETDSLLGTATYASELQFADLGYSFSDAGSDIILAADVSSSANPAHILDVQLQDNSDIAAYFKVYPVSANFPFDPQDISLPVELLSFKAQWENNIIRLSWQTASELNAAWFEVEKHSGQLSTILSTMMAAGNTSELNTYTCIDSSIVYGEKITYGLYQTDFGGQREKIGETSLTVSAPREWQLAQNYPNPFNPRTTIKFQIPNSQFATLKVFNVLGEEVTTLLSASLPSGSHSYQWDASGQASGIYYYQLVAGGYREVKKMIYLK